MREKVVTKVVKKWLFKYHFSFNNKRNVNQCFRGID